MIHPLAHIDDSTIGPRTKVWQFASITRKSVVGADCTIAPFALIDGAKVGNHCIVGMHTTLGPGCVIGDNVFIGPGVAFCNDVWPRADKEGFEPEMLFDGRVVANLVEDGASIGANAVLVPGVTIGAGAFVPAGAVVRSNVPRDHMWLDDKTTVPINTAWTKRRMRHARASLEISAMIAG